FFATLPSNGNGVVAGLGIPFAFPDYPFYASSSYPVVPATDKAAGPFEAHAKSDQHQSEGVARSGGPASKDGAFMSSRAAAVVRFDPDTGVRTAEADSRFDGFTAGPLALGQSTASADLTQAPNQAPTKRSAFTVASFTIAGVQVAMTDKGFKLGDQAPPTADLGVLFGALAKAGITVEFLPASETTTSINSAGMRITQAGTEPNNTQHRISLVIGRVSASIQGSSLPVLGETVPPAVDVPLAPPAPAGDSLPAAAPVPGPADPGGRGPVGSSAVDPVPSSASGALTLPDAAIGSDAPVSTVPLAMQLASPLSVPPQRGPDASGFYVVLLAAGLVMTAGSRLVAAVGVKLGFWTVYGAPVEAPVSVLRLPHR
ncbi:MAG: sporulation protein YunB, partial [Actinobacteria bacterium]|nr:sporulation protein YunB [Actinomycetota bacterium]